MCQFGRGVIIRFSLHHLSSTLYFNWGLFDWSRWDGIVIFSVYVPTVLLHQQRIYLFNSVVPFPCTCVCVCVCAFLRVAVKANDGMFSRPRNGELFLGTMPTRSSLLPDRATHSHMAVPVFSPRLKTGMEVYKYIWLRTPSAFQYVTN